MDLLNDITTEKNPPSFKLDKGILAEKHQPLKIKDIELNLSRKASIIDEKMRSMTNEPEKTEFEKKNSIVVRKDALDIDGKVVKVEEAEDDHDSSR